MVTRDEVLLELAMKRCVNCNSDRIRHVELAETVSVKTGEKVTTDFEGSVDGFRCEACGEEYFDGPDTERFEVLVARWLAEHGVATREAFRFMRKAIGLRAADLAGLLDVAAETVSHWETGKHDLPRNAVALLGAMVLEHFEGTTATLDRLRLLSEGPKLAKPRHIRLARVARA